MSEKKSEYIVIVGCGRLGSHLANQLSRDGHSVVVVDRDPNKFGNLTAEFSGFKIEGDATELAVLRQAKPQQADKLIAVTRKDNINLVIAQVAKTVFEVPTVVARVGAPGREAVFRDLGIHTICPVLLAARELLDRFHELKGRGSAVSLSEPPP